MAVAGLVVDRWLCERRPTPDLVDRLVCVWRGDLGDAQTPLPDERLDLVWVDDGSLWLSGPETTSWPRGYPPGTSAVGVGFKPGVGPAMLNVAASEVRDARVRLDELWGDRDARELAERVADHPDDRGRSHHGDHADQAPPLRLTSDPYKTRPAWVEMIPSVCRTREHAGPSAWGPPAAKEHARC